MLFISTANDDSDNNPDVNGVASDDIPPSESLYVGRVVTMLCLSKEYSGDTTDIGGVCSDDIGRKPSH